MGGTPQEFGFLSAFFLGDAPPDPPGLASLVFSFLPGGFPPDPPWLASLVFNIKPQRSKRGAVTPDRRFCGRRSKVPKMAAVANTEWKQSTVKL